MTELDFGTPWQSRYGLDGVEQLHVVRLLPEDGDFINVLSKPFSRQKGLSIDLSQREDRLMGYWHEWGSPLRGGEEVGGVVMLLLNKEQTRAAGKFLIEVPHQNEVAMGIWILERTTEST
jgi:hypothetical protein